ncbi:MAG: hypothetical protein KIT69_21435, partial [Propionibacteriaceae bacterium]|nr:hypothetical protein [Propionibacteriaceae bacterium]
MSPSQALPLRLWLGYWRAKQRYHRYTVEGLESLVDAPASLIVGYHGRPAAWDMCMLTVALYDALGYLPHAIFNGSIDHLPGARWLADALGFVGGDEPALAEAIGRGEHLVVTPGAATEGARTFWDGRYTVNWGGHRGYLKLSLKYRIPIVPVGASGTDDAYLGLVDGITVGKRLGLRRGWGLWTGIGPLGLFPFSPSFPVKMHQVIGDPIRPWAEDRARLDDPESLERAHRRVTGAVQALLDRAR